MKTQFFIMTALFLLLPSFALADFSCTTSGGKFSYFDGTANPTGHKYAEDASTAACGDFDLTLGSYIGSSFIISGSLLNDGTYTLNPSTGGGDVFFDQSVITSADNSTITFTVLTGSAGDFAGMISNAESGFATSTGFSLSAVSLFAGGLIQLFIGSGLGTLYGLRWWLAAAAVIAAIIYFTRRAFGFFRH